MDILALQEHAHINPYHTSGYSDTCV